jgi:serine/threonine-protein kinase
MDSIRSALAVLGALLLGWWLHLRSFLPRLPERIATHFDGAGRPNGWMTRAGLGSFDFRFLAFVLAVVIGSALLIRVLPVKLINIPNRDHWFAPERRRQSHARLLGHMLWFACLMVAFLIGVNHLVFLTNLQPAGARLSGTGMVALLVSFLAVLVVWTVRLYRLFPKPGQP